MELLAGLRTQAFRETETGTLLSSSEKSRKSPTSQTGFARSVSNTRLGMEIAILTNLPQTDALRLWLRNYIVWSIETLFLTITENFNGEIQTLVSQSCFIFPFQWHWWHITFCHPTCCVGQRAWSWQSSGISDFYLVDEIQGIYRGMMTWQSFGTFSLNQILLLQHLATQVNLKRFLKTNRSPKKSNLNC